MAGNRPGEPEPTQRTPLTPEQAAAFDAWATTTVELDADLAALFSDEPIPYRITPRGDLIARLTEGFRQ